MVATEWRVFVDRSERAEVEFLQDTVWFWSDACVACFFRSECEQQIHAFVLIFSFGITFDEEDFMIFTNRYFGIHCLADVDSLILSVLEI